MTATPSSVRRSVAEAICCPEGCERVKHGYRPSACLCDEDKAGDAIAAVLTAIEEPSEAMVDQGERVMHARGIWRAMLAQLKREIGT